ncbi:MAG: SusC/RagA family TonB-linked outer membrane protein [Tidjanibacter sp.]|nr:SusC/RagA family TonB-linked outer membrane protein [Tidjanibacter sp.]
MRKIVLSIFATLMFCVGAVAQGQRISGTVVDESGAPVLGATVSVVGTTTATITDFNGQYEIRADKKATLEFSYVGMATQTIAVGSRTTIDVVMRADAHQMEELIVVGYGSGVAAKSLVGSVSSVKGDKVANTPVANVADVLQGKIPGLQVFTSSGEPAAGSSMMMRGATSFTAMEPLVILDGTPVSGSVLNSLNSNDIENVVLLKDAASTSIYGSRAAAGVMYVTTKRGSAAKSMVQIRMQGGFSTKVENRGYQLMDGPEQMLFEEKIWPELTIDSKGDSWRSKKKFVMDNDFTFDWTDYAFGNNAPVKGIDASVAGAANGISYYISAGYLDTDGIAKCSRNTRYNFRSNIDVQAKEWLKIGANISLNYQEYDASLTGGFTFGSVDSFVYAAAPYNAPYEIIRNADGSWEYGEELTYLGEEDGFPNPQYNPHYILDRYPCNTTNVGLNGILYEEIKPIPGLTLKAVQAIDASDGRSSGTVLPSDFNEYSGQRGEDFSRYYRLSATNTIEYKFSIDDLHNWTLLAGQEANVAKSEGFGVGVIGLTDERVIMMGAGDLTQVQLAGHSISEEVFNSVFGRASYNYDGKYHIDASLRADGSSHFAKGHRWGTFWSIGGMWNVKGEEFMLPYDYINDLRLKASYGTTGNSDIGLYAPYGLIGVGGQYDGQIGMGVATPSNEGITWETVHTLNVGLSGRLFNRMSFDLDVYNRVTKDMLMDIPYSATTGYGSGSGNVGSMRNRGFELQLSYDLVQTHNLLWSIYGNVAYNDNEVLDLYGDVTDIVNAGSATRLAVGHSMFELSTVKFAGVDPRDGSALYYDLDGNVTKQWSDTYSTWLDGKKYMAAWSGGFGTSLMWGNLQVAADFSWIGDRWVMVNEMRFTHCPEGAAPGMMHFSKDMHNMWMEPGDITNIPNKDTLFEELSDRYLSNASFLRLKNLTVSYNIPGHWFGRGAFIQGARVYAIGRNLLTITDFMGVDPEYMSWVTQGVYPNTRQYTFGLELSF